MVDEKEIYQLNNKRAKTCKYRLKTMKFKKLQEAKCNVHPFLYLYFSVFPHSSGVYFCFFFCFFLSSSRGRERWEFENQTPYQANVCIHMAIPFHSMDYYYYFFFFSFFVHFSMNISSSYVTILNAPESLDERWKAICY